MLFRHLCLYLIYIHRKDAEDAEWNIILRNRNHTKTHLCILIEDKSTSACSVSRAKRAVKK